MIEPVLAGAALVAALAAEPPVGGALVCRLGQAGVAVRFASVTVFVDLYLSNHCEAALARPFDHRRITRAPLDPAELTTADVVICTHDHLDHLDVPSMRTLATASPRSTAVVPMPARRQVLALDWDEDRVVGTRSGQRMTIGDLTVDAFAVAHEDWDVDAELGNPYQGYVLSTGGVRVAHVGDAVGTPQTVETLAALTPDVLFVPVNGRSPQRAAMGFAGNMTAEEAAGFARAVGASTVVPMHYDMFAQNVDADAESRFLTACTGLGVPVTVLAVGEVLAVPA